MYRVHLGGAAGPISGVPDSQPATEPVDAVQNHSAADGPLPRSATSPPPATAQEISPRSGNLLPLLALQPDELRKLQVLAPDAKPNEDPIGTLQLVSSALGDLVSQIWPVDPVISLLKRVRELVVVDLVHL